jgi:hypothetical protein
MSVLLMKRDLAPRGGQAAAQARNGSQNNNSASQNNGGGRRRRRKAKPEPKAKAEPVLIVARRPDSPLMLKVSNRNIAATGRPKKRGVFHAALNDEAELDSAVNNLAPEENSFMEGDEAEAAPERISSERVVESPERGRRVARVAQFSDRLVDDLELKRERLLERLVNSEGRSLISKLVEEILSHNWELPAEQNIQIQVLEHVDERRAGAALDTMTTLLASQAPIKRPILDQRLRRLEECAEDPELRSKAARLRRSLRAA